VRKMNKIIPIILVAVLALTSLLLVIFHGQYYQEQIVDGTPEVILKEAIKRCPNYYRGLQACIAFSALIFISCIFGFILSCFNKKILCIIYTVFLGIFIFSLMVVTAAYTADSEESCNINSSKKSFYEALEQRGYTPDAAKLWKKTYYGGIVLMVVDLIVGIATVVVFCKHGV
jgi:hypothetical protein